MDHSGPKVATRYVVEASMKKQHPNPPSATEPVEGSRKKVNSGTKRAKSGADDFKPKTDLDGKTDSGPEPDVFGREIPPQDR
jgi:hypothetical protein